MKTKLPHSLATYSQNDEWITDLEELATILSNWGNIPKSINDKKAMEISLLAQRFLELNSLQKLRNRTVRS